MKARFSASFRRGLTPISPSALASPRLSTALVQAQRDAFGTHGYRRTDRDGIFHTDWTEEDGDHPDSEEHHRAPR